jgi:GTP pyrophosphokinase
MHFTTAEILISMGLDAQCICAALLYGLKDSNDIQKEYGITIAQLANNENKIALLNLTGKTVAEAERIRKMIFAIAADIREVFTMTAAKLAMLRFIDTERGEFALPLDIQKKEAEDAINIYAPLADRLGLIAIKDELEDLALKYLNNEAYLQVKALVALKKEDRDTFLSGITKVIKAGAAKAGIKIDVKARAKHFYSVYQKMRKRGKEAGELYDLLAVRIICDTSDDCYTMLGMVHRLWKPVEGRFKDYIASPKANGYQSLHTTVLASINDDEKLETLEIQIRTYHMHNTAEYGYASHWLYKKGTSKQIVDAKDLKTVNKMSDSLQKVTTGSAQKSDFFFDELKKSILGDNIYIFTPLHKVIELPLGGTAIDFAYSIHTAIGEHCAMAKADGKIIPLSAELKNTQVVDILTSISARPHLNWLSWVKTSKARSKIKNYFNEQGANESGSKHNTQIKGTNKSEAELSPRQPLHQGHLQAQTEAAGQNIAPNRVPPQNTTDSSFRVRVQDEKNMLVRFAKCCNPQYGDDIFGYISRGRGIIIHKKNCTSIANAPDCSVRSIATVWDTEQ